MDRFLLRDDQWERIVNLLRIKQFRRIATRYEKLDRNFSGMIILSCVVVEERAAGAPSSTTPVPPSSVHR